MKTKRCRFPQIFPEISSYHSVLGISIFTTLSSLATCITCLVLIINIETSQKNFAEWLKINDWSIREQSSLIESSISWLASNFSLILIFVFLVSIMYLFSCIVLTFAVITSRRRMFLFWLICHMVNLIIKIICFSCLTFMFFLIDLLIAVIFPLIAGMFLGLSFIIWRTVCHYYNNLAFSCLDYTL